MIRQNNSLAVLPGNPAGLRFEASRGAFVLIVALGILAALNLGFVTGAIAAGMIVLSLLVHEAGHLVAATLCGVRVKAIGICIKGAYLRRKDSKSAATELVIAICGPIASVVLFLIMQGDLPVIRWIAQLNLVLGLSNLLPIPSTDGARIVRSIATLVAAI